MEISKPSTHIYKHGSFATPILPEPTRFTLQQLEEKRAKGICYSYDSKYSKGHKCVEKKLFYIILKRRKKMKNKLQNKRIYTSNPPYKKKNK